MQKRRWARGWGVYWCFGFQRHRKRIGHAVILPETTSPGRNDSRAENPTQVPSIALPFAAPPSSPASFFQSEPPSAMQSPAGFKSCISASMYSPGPASIFAIGPYAHETQLVSPPVFSTFTTEPSTAPFTPPAESVHLTTPSSPEVPFAQLLDPKFRNGEGGQRYPLSPYEFQSYQLYPGSPIGQLISPSSGISGSGTSSPFLDSEFASGGHHFLEFRTGEAPEFLNLDILFTRDWGSRLCSGSVTPDAAKSTSSEGFTLKPHAHEGDFFARSNSRRRNDGASIGHRVSFELSAEEAGRCVGKKPVALAEAVSTSLQSFTKAERIEGPNKKVISSHECPVVDTSNDSSEKAVGGYGEETFHRHQKERTITLGSTKEFNFDNADGGDSSTPNINADWWANEKVVSKEDEGSKNWSFFPMIQPGVSNSAR
ncbi:uncharacterized protein LOC126796013 isoform X2 [Argentina anserina]|uniref:uncharacterized protein LOC126796013 isoform X2 n=1 Tax=Argentina anserina TaxID=57926 RepID=UPI00217668F4|nr:uncharacterized protein LOC126796013 isoform X2 [Potentilla anserina]